MLRIALTQVQEVLLGGVDIHQIFRDLKPVRVNILSLVAKNKLETSTKGKSLLSLFLLDENNFLHTGRITYHNIAIFSYIAITRIYNVYTETRM